MLPGGALCPSVGVTGFLRIFPEDTASVCGDLFRLSSQCSERIRIFHCSFFSSFWCKKTVSQGLATKVVGELTRAGFVAYWAGGCVRDLLRGVPAKDYDVATSATPDQVRQVFGRRRTLAVGESFGVIIVLGEDRSRDQVEVATFREEGGYTDGRRPGRVSFCTPEEDAKRRDFTINGMFFDPLTETVHDFVGGAEDLRRKVVRAIGNPQERMTEDKLRMLRGVRFAAALDFELDAATADAIRQMSAELTVVSAERIAQELRRMLSSATRFRAVQICFELGLFNVILPELTGGGTDADRVQLLAVLNRLQTDQFETAFAALVRHVPLDSGRKASLATSGSVNSACLRLKLSNDETERILWLRARLGRLKSLPAEPIAALKRLAAEPDWRELLELERAIAEVLNEDLSPYSWIDETLKQIPAEELNPPPLLTGRDLLREGFTAGPQFKTWLELVRDAQLNGEIRDRDEAMNYIHHLSQQPKT